MKQLLTRYKLAFILIGVLAIIALPLTIFQLGKQQERRSGAAGPTVTVTLSPASQTYSPGASIPVTLSINSGASGIRGLDATVTYDAAYIQLTGFTPNPQFNQVLVNGPPNNTIGNIRFAVGSSAQNAPTGSSVVVGVFNFTAKAVGTAKVSFGNLQIVDPNSVLLTPSFSTPAGTYTITGSGQSCTTSGVCGGGQICCTDIGLSTASGAPGTCTTVALCDSQKKTNSVCAYQGQSPDPKQLIACCAGLSGTLVCQPPLSGVPSPEPTGPTIPPQPTTTSAPRPTSVQAPSNTPVPTGPTSAPSPTGGLNSKTLSMKINLPGIGNSTNAKLNLNNAPKHPTKNTEVKVINAQGVATSFVGNVPYNTTTGKFEGTAGLGSSLADGPYTVKVRMDNTLWKSVPGIIQLTNGTITLPEVTLVTGDISQDNQMDIGDYNALIGCYGKTSCTNHDKTDLNDDGAIDELDLSLMINAFLTRNGD